MMRWLITQVDGFSRFLVGYRASGTPVDDGSYLVS